MSLSADVAVSVKETPIQHASDLIRWLDGTSSPTLEPGSMALLNRALAVRFDALPPDLQWLNKPGRTALWRRPMTPLIEREALEAERTRPDLALFRVVGSVRDPSGAYNPRVFDLTLGDGEGSGLVLYPSPAGTRFGSGGGLQGAVHFDGGADPAAAGWPAAWAIVEVAVTVGENDLRRFRAQCDGKGDFRLSLWRLPPLPQGTLSYVAELRVLADPDARAGLPPDPETLEPARAAPVAAPPDPPPDPPPPGDGFDEALTLSLVPGRIHRVQSHGRRVLAIRPGAAPVPDP